MSEKIKIAAPSQNDGKKANIKGNKKKGGGGGPGGPPM